jgi:hypothetical protein
MFLFGRLSARRSRAVNVNAQSESGHRPPATMRVVIQCKCLCKNMALGIAGCTTFDSGPPAECQMSQIWRTGSISGPCHFTFVSFAVANFIITRHAFTKI